MPIHVKEVTSRKELCAFIYLPEKIHRDHENWVPPLYIDEKEFYNPRKNSSFAFCDTILALAYDGDVPVGRIMGIINHKYNNVHNEKSARFYNLECPDNPEIAASLLQYIEEWAGNKGMSQVVGPLGFSDKDPQGLMIEGFDEPVVIATNSNFSYLVPLVEGYGFGKALDLVVYKLVIPDEIPSFYDEIRKRTLARNNVMMLEFSSRKELKPYIKPVLKLVNETFTNIYGFSQLDDGEMDYLANRYMPVINPKFVKIIIDPKKNIVGFLLALPDIAEGIRQARGRLFPWGFYKILRSVRQTKLLVMLLGAIKREYRNYGLDALMGVKLLETAKKEGMEVIDSHLVMETNTKMRAEYERLGGKVYKRYRIFQKSIAGK